MVFSLSHFRDIRVLSSGVFDFFMFWWYFSLMRQRNFQVSKMVQGRSAVREIRVFRDQVGFLRVLSMFSTPDGESIEGDPSFFKVRLGFLQLFSTTHDDLKV